jgi:hypothetical protein
MVVAIAAAVAFHQAGARRAVVVGMLLSVLFAAHSGVGAAIGLLSLFVAAGLVLTNRGAATTSGGRRPGRPPHAVDQPARLPARDR